MLKVFAFTFSPIQENTYVLSNEDKECIIIDPGCYFPEEQQELKDYIDKNGFVPKRLLNTHCHLDHVFGNNFVADTWGLTLNIHEKEKQMLEMAPASGLMYDMPFDNYQGNLDFVKEGEMIMLGNDELEIFFTPGHSPGHVCFYCARQKFVIAGDVLFNGSIGRTDLPFGNYETLVSSIREKLFVLPDDVIVYNGHGPSTTIGNEKKYNPFVGDLV